MIRIIQTIYFATLVLCLINCQSSTNTNTNANSNTNTNTNTASQSQTVSTSSSSKKETITIDISHESHETEPAWPIEQNQYLVKHSELIACGNSNCQIIREFAFYEKHNYNCHDHSLSINFFTYSLTNGTKFFERGQLTLIKKHYNLEEAPIIPFNLIHKSEKKHPICIRIKRFFILLLT